MRLRHALQTGYGEGDVKLEINPLRQRASCRPNLLSAGSFRSGGGGGIRTHETLSGLTVFKTAAINQALPPLRFSTVYQMNYRIRLAVKKTARFNGLRTPAPRQLLRPHRCAMGVFSNPCISIAYSRPPRIETLQGTCTHAASPFRQAAHEISLRGKNLAYFWLGVWRLWRFNPCRQPNGERHRSCGSQPRLFAFQAPKIHLVEFGLAPSPTWIATCPRSR
jgi:hypothetical protein